MRVLSGCLHILVRLCLSVCSSSLLADIFVLQQVCSVPVQLAHSTEDGVLTNPLYFYCVYLSVAVCACVCVRVRVCMSMHVCVCHMVQWYVQRFPIDRLRVRFPTIMVTHVFLLFLRLLLAFLSFSWVVTNSQCMPEYVV